MVKLCSYIIIVNIIIVIYVYVSVYEYVLYNVYIIENPKTLNPKNPNSLFAISLRNLRIFQ